MAVQCESTYAGKAKELTLTGGQMPFGCHTAPCLAVPCRVVLFCLVLPAELLFFAARLSLLPAASRCVFVFKFCTSPQSVGRGLSFAFRLLALVHSNAAQHFS